MSNFKYKDMKVFGSSEWLANNEKKYRLVYDESESTYIWGEFSFYNKKFDEEKWQLNCLIKCFNTKGEEICSQDASREISSDENIVFIRKGWGNDSPGAFWRSGEYRWEAWVDGSKIASKTFYVVNKGSVTEDQNPYFNITSVKLYEGPGNDVAKDDRKYLKCFAMSDTRYVWVEFEAENLIKSDVDYWPCDLQFNFYSDTGQLKGSVNQLMIVYPSDETIRTTNGWGNEKGGHWFKDNYRLEIVFMDTLIAVVPFTVSDDSIDWDDSQTVPAKVNRAKVQNTSGEQSLDEIMKDLDEMIGLDSIKTKIREYTSYLNFIKLRNEKGIEDPTQISLHTVFTGNPGTGKTTVALMLGKIYKKLGLLSKGHVIEVDRADLIGEYIGQTAPKTKEMIKKAKGGILFIDEAYSLARKADDSKDFGKEAIEILIKEMSGNSDFAVIAAGYPEEMKVFLESNPGIKSRFNLIFDFPDYIPQELQQIATFALSKRNVNITDDAKQFLYTKLVEAYRNRDKAFGNARYVNSLIDEAKLNMGLRLMKHPDVNNLTAEDLSTVTLEDFKKIFEAKSQKTADIPVDEELLKEALHELRTMTGLNGVKHEIDELVKLVRFYREIGKDVRHTFSLHTVFTGNPGTGKTTVARIIAKIYKGLGILEKGHLVEADRQKMVASFVGQTAEKTNYMVEQAMGGVLFIDEAYALAQDASDTFGKEAVETLLKRMEDRRGDFVVIVAGYPDNMDKFLNTNPGLKSRFDRTLNFEDYKPEELMEIANSILSEEKIKMEEKAMEHLKNYFSALYDSKDKYFGNGRSVRKVMEQAIKNQHLRLAAMEASQRTPELIETLAFDDVDEFKVDEVSNRNRSQIGFNK